MKLQQVSCWENSNTLRNKGLFLFFRFQKVSWKNPVLTVTPKAEEGVTFNSVPTTEHRLQLHTYVINAITSSAWNYQINLKFTSDAPEPLAISQCSVPPEGCAWGIGAGPAKPVRAPNPSNTGVMHWGSIKANTSLRTVFPTLSSELHSRISWINIYSTPERRAGIISLCFKDGRRWEKAEAICCNSQRKSVVKQGRVQCSHCLCLCHKTILPVPKCQAPAWWCAVVLAY